MNIEEFRKVKQLAEEHRIILLYCGVLTEDMLLSLGDSLKAKLAREETSVRLIRKVFSVFVEQVQNVIHYAADSLGGDFALGEAAVRSGTVAIGVEGERYYVVCENRVANGIVPSIREQLARLRNMDKGELRQLFREKVREEPAPSSKGAGLGFIEIARRSSEPIEYSFVPADGDQSLFTLKAFV